MSEPDSGDSAKQRKSSAKPWIISGCAVVAVAGAYFGGAAWISSQIPANTTVSGIAIGSLSQDEARATLQEQLAPRAEEPIDVTVNAKDYQLDPAAAGLGLDVDATVEQLTGYELNPGKLWQRLTGSYQAEPVTTVDEAKLTGELEQLAKKADAEVAEGTIEFEGAKAKVISPVSGVQLDVEDSAHTVQDEWKLDGEKIPLSAEVTEPAVSAEQLQAFHDETVAKLLSAPVTLSNGEKQVELSPASIASAAKYSVNDEQQPQLVLDDQALYKAATKNSELSSTAKDAKVVFSGGKPKIIESTTGMALETKDLGAKVLAAGTGDSRTAEVRMETKEADFTTEDAKKLGIKEEIVEFSTPYPASDTVRTKNLKAGAKRLTGVVVKPGETFSLLEALGPITVANGYYSSGVVENGFSTEAVGGGLSQISTQMYNVGFLAGYDDITHKPHSRWFERYPAGREATLWEGQVDMKWKNNTPYGVMIEAWVSPDAVHTRLWSTKYWKVSESSSGKHSFTNPETKYNDAEKCISESGGKKGFSISITRNRTSIDGSKTLPPDVTSWTYAPWHKVVCGKKP